MVLPAIPAVAIIIIALVLAIKVLDPADMVYTILLILALAYIV